MIVSKYGFMDSALSKSKKLIAGGTNSKHYVFNTDTNQLILKFDKKYYSQFIRDDTCLLLVRPNAEFEVFDLAKQEVILKRKLPYPVELLLPHFCWDKSDVIYFEASNKMWKEDEKNWRLIKYDIGKDIFYEFSLEGNLVACWKEYLVLSDDIATDDEEPNIILKFYKNGELHRQIFIGNNEFRFVDDKLYVIKNTPTTVDVYEYLGDFSCNKVISINTDFKFLDYDLFDISKKYVAIQFTKFDGYIEMIDIKEWMNLAEKDDISDIIFVYRLSNNQLVFEQAVPYRKNINLVDDKIYIGAMDRLYMFNLTEKNK